MIYTTLELMNSSTFVNEKGKTIVKNLIDIKKIKKAVGKDYDVDADISLELITKKAGFQYTVWLLERGLITEPTQSSYYEGLFKYHYLADSGAFYAGTYHDDIVTALTDIAPMYGTGDMGSAKWDVGINGATTARLKGWCDIWYENNAKAIVLRDDYMKQGTETLLWIITLKYHNVNLTL